MKFGVGVDYSLKALLALAERYPSPEPMRVEEIAEAQGVPENYPVSYTHLDVYKRQPWS